MVTENKDALSQAALSFTSLATKLSELCGRNKLPDYNSFFGSMDYTAYLASLTKPKDNVMDVVLGRKMPALALLEERTRLLAQNSGFAEITSVVSQITAISTILSSQMERVRELVAPTAMLMDLQKIATQTHQSIVDSGSLSTWKLGVLNSASFMVNRQIDWASQFYSTVFGERSLDELGELDGLTAKVNIISRLPNDLEEEKKNHDYATLEEALAETTTFKLSERGKRLIDKIATINTLCERKGLKPLFKYTGATLRAAATMAGTVCIDKDSFDEVIEGFYMFFYENLSRIKGLVTDDAVRKEDIYQCIFRMKDIRTEYHHDFEHGSKSDIRTKNREIGKCYLHYAGKQVLFTKEDYLCAQNKIYDEFNTLIDHLFSEVYAKVN